MYIVYIFTDPKTNVYRYVGKGKERRPKRHLKQSHNVQLDRMIQKRQKEGFQVHPRIIPAASNDDAKEMEILLIAMIGRLDTGAGTLFNCTDGGEGVEGRMVLEAERTARAHTWKVKSPVEMKEFGWKISKALSSKSADELASIAKRKSDAYQSNTIEQKLEFNARKAEGHRARSQEEISLSVSKRKKTLSLRSDQEKALTKAKRSASMKLENERRRSLKKA